MLTAMRQLATAQTAATTKGWYFQGDVQEVGGSPGKGMLWIKNRDAQNVLSAHYLAYGGLITDALLTGQIRADGSAVLTGKTIDGKGVSMTISVVGENINLSYRITQPDVLWKATTDYTATLTKIDPATLPLFLDPAREFNVGDLVEVDKISDGKTWVRGRVTGISGPIHWSEGRCQQYYVEATESNQVVGATVDCRRIRAASSASNPKPAPVAGGRLVPGEYPCTRNVWDYAEKRSQVEYKGVLTLYPNGTYKVYENGDLGRYTYNASTGAMRFTGGYFDNGNPVSASFTNNGRTSQLAITIKTGSGDLNWGCGHTN